MKHSSSNTLGLKSTKNPLKDTFLSCNQNKNIEEKLLSRFEK